TVRELLEQGAVALIDVHRDAIPAEMYRTEVAGEEMTKVRLVVGRQNPNREANLELAKRVKALADEQYPGLVKGIFHARGNYNQDVGPRTLLLEFGTHETSLDEAIRSTKFIAEIFPAAAGLASGTGEAASAIGGAGLRSALWLLLLAGAAVFAYLWINEGTPQGAWRRLKGFFRREAGRAAARSRRGGAGEAGRRRAPWTPRPRWPWAVRPGPPPASSCCAWTTGSFRAIPKAIPSTCPWASSPRPWAPSRRRPSRKAIWPPRPSWPWRPPSFGKCVRWNARRCATWRMPSWCPEDPPTPRASPECSRPATI